MIQMKISKILKALYLVILAFTFGACASKSHERQMTIGMASGFTVGAVVGSQKDHSKEAHALMWGSFLGMIAGAYSIYSSNPDEEIRSLNAKLKLELEERERMLAPKLVHSSSHLMGDNFPKKYQSLVTPGEWRLFETDEWEEDGENRLRHIDKILEMNPPTLQPRLIPHPVPSSLTKQVSSSLTRPTQDASLDKSENEKK